MPIDIYLRLPEDPNYDEFEMEVNDSVSIFIQNVEMILTTNKGDIFGAPGLGANLESYLWSPYVSSSLIQEEILDQINTYCTEKTVNIPYVIDVSFIKSEPYDSILVDVIINNKKIIGVVATP